MSHPAPAPTPSESAGIPPTPPAESPTTRRTFLLGGAAGVVVGGAAGAGAAKVPDWVRGPAPTSDPPPPQVIEKPLPVGTKLSYAQYGEDLVVNSLFYSIKLEKPTYLDIGAYEPIDSNNTYFFYEKGSRGVVVEPTPKYVEKLKAFRPGDTVLGVGVGVTDATEMNFYIMTEPQQNTFDKAHAEKFVREKGYKIEQVLKIPLVNINRIMAEHFGGKAPDYLSIDVEGMEFEITKTIDFTRFRPKVICVETLIAARLAHNPEITKFMEKHGYEVRGMTYPNTIYMDKALLKDPPAK
jgi:FkbM family methyltransferase